MKAAIKTFHKGMNTDLDYSMIDQGMYLYAKNFRVGNHVKSYNALGALENVPGNTLEFDLNTMSYVIENDPYSTFTISFDNFIIYKSVTIRDTFVFFVTCDMTVDSDPTVTDVNMIIKSTPVDGVFSEYTIVFGTRTDMNFSTEMSAIGRYESESIQKVYWATGKDPLRFVNIQKGYTDRNYASPVISNEASDTDHVPEIEFRSINIEGIYTGGLYKSGAVQYAYQLYSKNGSISTISPVTNPVFLSAASQEEVGGSEIGEDSNKAVQISINLPNSVNFDRIRIISLYYDKLFTNPVVNIIAEQEHTGNITFTDVGRPVGEMSYEEFLVFNQTTYSPKSIDSKDSILFSANVKESTFKSETLDLWDSRAYMFPETSSFTFVKTGSTYSSYQFSEIGNISLDEDATVEGVLDFSSSNIGNADSSTHPLYRRFKPSSSDLGGEGLNIEFSYEETGSDIDYSGSTKGYDLEINKSQTVAGLQPNEVYRFGIVFYNGKGQTSFVKWIQDIRIPFVEMVTGNEMISRNTVSSPIIAKNIAVRFTIKNAPWDNDPNIKGWQIVRAKRESKDREILYNGLLIPVEDAYNEAGEDEDFCRPRSTKYGATTYEIGMPLLDAEFDTANEVSEFISPDLLFNDSEIPDNSYCVVNRYCRYDSEYTITNPGSHVYLNAKGYETGTWPSYTGSVIDRSMKVGTSYFGDNAVVFLDSTGSNSRYRNVTKTHSYHSDDISNKYYNVGIGGTKHVLKTAFPSVAWNTDRFIVANADIVQDVSETRYGGSSYESRQLNTYIPYGNINRTSAYTDVTPAADFNGDTFIKMFPYLRNIFQYKYMESSWGDGRAMQEVIIFPMYTSINIDYKSDKLLKYLEEDVDIDSDGIPKTMLVQEDVQTGIQYQPELYNENVGDLYTYNSVYSKQNEAKQFYPKPFDFIHEPVLDTKVIASEKKFDGEHIDSWTRFKSANFIEVDSRYGPINLIKTFRNNLFYFQDKAFGVLGVNDRSLIQDNNIGQLAIGTGGVLERYDYVDTNTGCTSNKHLDTSNSAIYWYDSVNEQLLEYSQKLTYLDLEKGIQSFIKNKDTDLNAVAVDTEYKEVLFSFENDNTLVYNQVLQAFSGDYTFTPYTVFRGFDNSVYSVPSDSKSKIYLHNFGNRGEFYGVIENSTIRILANEDYNQIKVFDNLEFPSKSLDATGKNLFEDTFDKLRVYNSYQDSGEYDLVKDGTYTNDVLPLTRRERMWNTFIPRNAITSV